MLARQGLRVCLLDRSRFPSDTLSTHVIQPCGVAVLDRLGMLDTVLAAGAVPLTQFSLTADDARIEASIDAHTFGAPGLSVRRVTLDHLLVQAATDAGADVRTGAGVTDLLWNDGRVAGVETKQGSLHAQLVIGADGRASTVARLVGSAEYNVAPPGRMFAWAYFDGVADAEGHLRLGALGEMTFVASPTDAGLFLAAVCPPMADKDVFLGDREGGYMAAIDAWPELAGLLAGANRRGPIRVMANWHGYFREAAGRGWALLGDAGNFKDPSPAQGISDALRQAEHLADVVATGLGESGDIDDELLHWWRWRDDDGYAMHWFATDMGAAGSPAPLATQFTRDMAGDAEATKALLGVLNHEVEPSQLFTPRRLGRAAIRAVRNRPDQIPAMAKEAAAEIRNEAVRFKRRHHPRLKRRSATERMLLVIAVVGLVVPNVFFGLFLAKEGFDLGGYFSLWTGSLPSTQLLLDLAVAALAFFAWAAVEGRRAQIRYWWICIPATLLVGLCFGLPLFLLIRERALARRGSRARPAERPG